MIRAPTRWVFASGNRGKRAELARRLAPHRIELVAQGELGVSAVDETGTTFEANAVLKAEYACRSTGLPALADDSGLEVAALGGAPGVYSARYAGPEATDADNVAKLLAALEGREDRRARFVCVLALVLAPGAEAQIFHGTWEGEILHAPRGEGGFGYDPIFFVPTEGVSAAELPLDVKNRLSHRGRAADRLLAALAAPDHPGSHAPTGNRQPR